MKTTLDLPDDLMRAVKIRAVEENRRLRDTVAELLRRVLAQEQAVPPTVRKRLRLPLVACVHEALWGEEEPSRSNLPCIRLPEDRTLHRERINPLP